MNHPNIITIHDMPYFAAEGEASLAGLRNHLGHSQMDLLSAGCGNPSSIHRSYLGPPVWRATRLPSGCGERKNTLEGGLTSNTAVGNGLASRRLDLREPPLVVLALSGNV